MKEEIISSTISLSKIWKEIFLPQVQFSKFGRKNFFNKLYTKEYSYRNIKL